MARLRCLAAARVRDQRRATRMPSSEETCVESTLTWRCGDGAADVESVLGNATCTLVTLGNGVLADNPHRTKIQSRAAERVHRGAAGSPRGDHQPARSARVVRRLQRGGHERARGRARRTDALSRLRRRGLRAAPEGQHRALGGFWRVALIDRLLIVVLNASLHSLDSTVSMTNMHSYVTGEKAQLNDQLKALLPH
jgi:hypothetical protein